MCLFIYLSEYKDICLEPDTATNTRNTELGQTLTEQDWDNVYTSTHKDSLYDRLRNIVTKYTQGGIMYSATQNFPTNVRPAGDVNWKQGHSNMVVELCQAAAILGKIEKHFFQGD